MAMFNRSRPTVMSSSGRLAMTAAVMMATQLTAPKAQALGNIDPAEILLPQMERDFLSETADYRLRVSSTLLREARINSLILTPEDEVVSAAPEITTSFSDIASISIDGIVGAKPGDVLEISSAQNLTLSVGIYAERITLTMIDDNLDVPLARTYIRYMDVADDGIHWLSANEYSALVEPTTTSVDALGNRIVVYVGTTNGEKLDLSQGFEFDEADAQREGDE